MKRWIEHNIPNFTQLYDAIASFFKMPNLT